MGKRGTQHIDTVAPRVKRGRQQQLSPDAGEKWNCKWNGKQVTVLAVASGYVMARYPRCYPLIEPLKPFLNLYERADG